MIVRITAKLAKKIGLGALPAFEPHANPFADWSARVFFVRRSPHLLFTNTPTLYSFVLPAKGVTKPAVLLERMEQGMQSFLESEGHATVFDRYVAPEISRIHFARAANPSVTGSMNDLVRIATFMMSERDMEPIEISLLLNDIPMGSLCYGLPRQVFRGLLPPGPALVETVRLSAV